MPSIHIEQQPAQIVIESTPAQLHIKTPRPQMRIKNVAPEMTLEREDPRFTIDLRPVFSQWGLKRPLELSQSLHEQARIKTFEAIGEAVREGDYFGRVEQKGARVAQYERRKSHAPRDTEINVTLAPSERPQVEWESGHVNIRWSRYQLLVEWDDEFLPHMTVDPRHSIEIFLRNKPHIKISVIDGGSQADAGRVIDAQI